MSTVLVEMFVKIIHQF